MHNQNDQHFVGDEFSRFKIIFFCLLCSSTRGIYSYINSAISGREIYLEVALPNSSSKFDLYIRSDWQAFPQVKMKYKTTFCDHAYATAINLTPLISVSIITHFPETLSPLHALRIFHCGCCLGGWCHGNAWFGSVHRCVTLKQRLSV